VRKHKYDPLNFDRGTDWVPPYVLEQQRKQKEEEAKAKLPADFSNVTGSAETVAGPQPSYVDQRKAELLDALGQLKDIGSAFGQNTSAAFQSIFANAEGTDLQSKMALSSQEIQAQEAQANSLMQRGKLMGNQGFPMINQAQSMLNEVNDARSIQANPEQYATGLKENAAYRQLLEQKQAEASAQLNKQDPTHILSIVSNLAGHPEALLPVAGGVVGGAVGTAAGPEGTMPGAYIGSTVASGPMTKVMYDDAFNHARDQGVDVHTAQSFAKWMAGSSFALQALGGGLASRFSGAAERKVITDNLFQHFLKQTGKAGAVGAGFGVAQTNIQDLGNAAIAATTGDKKLAKVAEANVPQTVTDYFTQQYEAAAGGALSSAIPAAPHTSFELMREAGRRAARLANARVRDTNAQKPIGRDLNAADQPSLFGESEPAIGPVQAPVATPEANAGQASTVDVNRLNNLNRQIKVITNKTTPTPEESAKLLSLVAARNRLVGSTGDIPRARVENGQMVEVPQPNPSLGLDFPSQPRNPEFTGLPEGEAQPTASEQATAPQVKPSRTRIPKKGTTPSGSNSSEDFENLKKQLGLAQKGGNTTGTTVEDVYDHLQKQSRAAASTGTISKLLSDGNVHVVPDESYIPAGSEKMGAAGFYDGSRTYVVANRLDGRNITGELLNVAAHEIHHAANLSGKVTIAGLVGKDNVQRTNAKIEKAAQLGDKAAQWAVSHAKDADNANPGSYEDELIPYMINRARATRDHSTAVRATVSDVISAVRTSAKRWIGKSDVNLNDIAYLSDKLLEEVAQKGDRLESPGASRAMIYDENAPSFKAEEAKGNVYTSVDGRRKFVLSDSEAKFTPDAMDKLKDGGQTTLGEVLNHDTLFREFPEARNIPVQKADLAGNWGMYEPDTGKIFIDLNSNSGAEQARGSLMHEIQHALQDKAGRDKDFFNPSAMSGQHRMILNNMRDIAKVHDGITKDVLRHAKGFLASISDEALRARTARRMMSGSFNDKQKADILNSAIRDSDTHLSPELDKLLRGWDEATQVYNEYAKQANVVYAAEHQRYERNITEAEAFFTQDHVDVPQGKLPVNPEGNFRHETIDVPSQQGEQTQKAAAANSRAMLKIADLEDIEAETEATWRRGITTLAKIFTPTKGLGDDLNMILFGAAGKQAHLSSVSENLITRVWDSIHAVVKGGESEESVIRDIDETVNKANAQSDPKVRQSMISALDRRYPGVGRTLNEVRDFKIQLRDQIIEQRLRDPKPLSDLEKNVFKKMLAKAETYTTRAYLSQLGGKESLRYARSVMRAFNADPNSELGSRVRDAINYLKKNALIIPDANGLEALKDYQIKRIYDTWVGKPIRRTVEDKRAFMIKELGKLPPKTQEELHNKAIQVVREIIGLTKTSSAISTYLRGGKQNRTVLEARKDVPAEIRNLMGEITHPVVREMVSLMRMSSLIHKTQSLLDIHETLKGKEWGDTISDEFPNRLSSEAYGPMDGKFVSHRLADLMGDTRVFNTTVEQEMKAAMLDPKVMTGAVLGPIMTAMRGFSTLQKTSNLILTPFAHMANLAGSWTMALMNGNFNPVDWGRAMHRTAIALKGAVNPRLSDKSLGLVGELQLAKVMDSATMGQWQSQMHRDILEQITRLDPTNKGFRQQLQKIVHNAVLKSGKKGLDYMRSVYAFMDVWSKVAAYQEKKQYLTDFYKAEGINKPEEHIIREAGYETSKTNISYDMAIPLFRLLERNFSPVFMFATFTSECFRATAQSYMQVFRDIARAQQATSPEGRALAQKAATKRLVGTLAATAGLNALFMGIIHGESDKDRRKRKLDASWEQTDISIPVGLDADGNEHRIGITRLDAIGPVNELFRNVALAPTPEKQFDAMKGAITQFFIKSKTSMAVLHVLGDVLAHSTGQVELDQSRKKNTAMERNFPEAYQKLVTALDAGDIGENTSELLDTLTPGAMRWLVDPQANAVVKVRPGDWQAGAGVMDVLGGKTYVRDPDKAMTFRIIDYTKGMAALRTEQKSFLDKQKDIDPKVIRDKLIDLKDRERKLYNDLADAYDGYLAYDKKPADVHRIMDDARLTKAAKRSLLIGQFRSELADPGAMARSFKASLKGATPAERRDLEARYHLLRQIYSQENE
jgi:hypothetical protein